MAAGSPDVGMQDPDLQARPVRPRESQGQVLFLVTTAVADAVHGDRDAVSLEPHRLDDVRTEHGDPVGPVPDGRPLPVDRIVVAVHDERADAGSREAAQAVPESQLGPGPALGAVVDVTREHAERDLPGQRQPDEVVERSQRGVAQRIVDLTAVGTKALDRRVEMEIGGVQESHRERRYKRLVTPSGMPPGRASAADGSDHGIPMSCRPSSTAAIVETVHLPARRVPLSLQRHGTR